MTAQDPASRVVAQVLAPISVGELIDKITILEIKLAHVSDAGQRANIDHELSELRTLVRAEWAPVLGVEKPALAEVNRVIWDLEELVRTKHDQRSYDTEFIGCAVAIFERNDERAAIKKRINVRLGSSIVEEKIYIRGGDEAAPC